MKSISEILASAASMSIRDLEEQMHLRDQQVVAIRAEMGKIHDVLEPKWIAEIEATAGPADLAQHIGEKKNRGK